MKQQLETSKQIVEAEGEYKRMGKGREIAQSRRIYRLLQTDVFYVESESTDNVYYFVKFKPDVDVEYCSCPDNSMRGQKCKHIWSIEFATRFDTLKDIDKLPEKGQKGFQSISDRNLTPIGRVDEQIAATKIEAKSYTDDDYSF